MSWAPILAGGWLPVVLALELLGHCHQRDSFNQPKRDVDSDNETDESRSRVPRR
jgi:hypothetical protein